MKKVFNDNFEIRGAETTRVARTFFFAKLLPVGNLGGGPHLRCLLVLTVLHYLSAPLFWLLVRQENKVRRVAGQVKKLLNR